MIIRLILLGTFIFNIIHCYDSDSSEDNRIEVSPFYDTIIFSDIADIINDFENNNTPFKTPASSNSESGENIEDLLSEYQHYLDRAHKQRLDYLEKTKTKSNIPLFRHDRYSKMKPFESPGKYDNFYYTNSYFVPTPYKLPQLSYNNPLDLLIPLRPKERYMTKLGTTTPLPGRNNDGELKNLNKAYEKKIIDSPIHKTTYIPTKLPCYCKNNQIPCECNCKQCLVNFNKFSEYRDTQKTESTDDEKKSFTHNLISSDNSFSNANHSPDIRNKNTLENVNIRIKVDIQIPKQGSIGKVFNEQNIDSEGGSSREMSAMLNLPYFNVPVPMDMFGYKKISKFMKHDTPTPLHKITIHKKKKSRVSNSNKKHRKKVISFHNIKLEPSQYLPNSITENYNISGNDTNKIANMQQNATEIPASMPNKSIFVNDTQIDESIYLIGTNKTKNDTQEERKSDNSIYSDYSKLPLNISNTEKAIILRIKRNTVNDSANILKETTEGNTLIEFKNETTSNKEKEKRGYKKTDKNLLTDSELLYWPSGEQNKSGRKLKNITYRIFENENKKAKLNMSKEAILKNHTRALEQAIFGKADWDDVDTVAPDFVAFVGKYIRGVLTFCSQSVCHSMKCAEKTCVHRICTPEERFNNKGHCMGSNTTDSIASLESIMDLPSNIAFEIVDILQERMLGKLFGKMTLCISTKCITFAACKKTIAKSKCNTKELNSVGQCPITDVKLLQNYIM